LDVVLDGAEAMKFLRKQGRYVDAQRPDLVLLDLNMPRMTGLEVLQALWGEDSLRSIPVVVLTTSSAVQDVQGSYDLGASSYLVKPVGFQDFMSIVEVIETYWFHTVLLPSQV